MSDLVVSKPAGSLTQFSPREAMRTIAQADAVIDYAKRLKDIPLLERAIDEKIDQQREFVAWWRANVTPRHRPGRGGVELNADQRLVSKADAQSRTGITQQQVSKWAKRLAKESEYRAALFGAFYHFMMSDRGDDDVHNHRAQGTGENEWYTPAVHIERVRALFGEIDLDPASSPSAQKIVRAKRYLTIKDDGLKHEWSGRVWLNPPYAQPAIQHFAEKWAAETASGRIVESVMLTHNYTDTEWFHIAARACDAICFTRGRIAFLSPDGTKAVPTQGQAFFYFGARVDAFASAFSQVGFTR
jgi:phage N-6-adenine-methyltransferase